MLTPSAPRRSLIVTLALVLPAACGSTTTTPALPAPRFIEGGGLADGPFTGALNLYVADDETRAPISGAAVRVGGSADPTACAATTDSTGLAIFDGKTCTLRPGKQSITASASGYAPSTWIGIDAGNVTMSIRATTAAPVDTATVSGTITGWDDLPEPAVNHNLLGIVGYSAGMRLSDAANNLVQDKRMVHVGAPLNTDVAFPSNVCVKNALVSDCAWRMKTRTGAQAHYAVVVDQDTKGTQMDDSDDTFTVIGWSIKRGVNLIKDQTADGEALALLADGDMQAFTATIPAPPTGLDYVSAFPLLELGGDGRVAIVLPALDLMHTATRVPALKGALADGRYDLFAKAQDAKDKDQPGTLSWTHGVDIAQPVAALNWVAPPSALTAMGGTYSFTPATGATVSGGELQTMAGKRAWSITIFDGTTSFTLPGVSPDPLPAGPALFVASSLVIPDFKATDVRFDDVVTKLTHIANDQIMFTH